MTWKLHISNRAKKDLKRLDRQNQTKVRDALRRMAETQEGDITYLTDVRPLQWRLRVGDWRVRFKKHTNEKVFEILHIRHRSQTYDR